MYQKVEELCKSTRREILSRPDKKEFSNFFVGIFLNPTDNQPDKFSLDFWTGAKDPESSGKILTFSEECGFSCTVEDFLKLMNKVSKKHYCEARLQLLQIMSYGVLGSDLKNVRKVIKLQEKNNDWSLGGVGFAIIEQL